MNKFLLWCSDSRIWTLWTHRQTWNVTEIQLSCHFEQSSTILTSSRRGSWENYRNCSFC
jgi:hypothetical protein